MQPVQLQAVQVAALQPEAQPTSDERAARVNLIALEQLLLAKEEQQAEQAFSEYPENHRNIIVRKLGQKLEFQKAALRLAFLDGDQESALQIAAGMSYADINAVREGLKEQVADDCMRFLTEGQATEEEFRRLTERSAHMPFGIENDKVVRFLAARMKILPEHVALSFEHAQAIMQGVQELYQAAVSDDQKGFLFALLRIPPNDWRCIHTFFERRVRKSMEGQVDRKYMRLLGDGCNRGFDRLEARILKREFKAVLADLSLMRCPETFLKLLGAIQEKHEESLVSEIGPFLQAVERFKRSSFDKEAALQELAFIPLVLALHILKEEPCAPEIQNLVLYAVEVVEKYSGAHECIREFPRDVSLKGAVEALRLAHNELSRLTNTEVCLDQIERLIEIGTAFEGDKVFKRKWEVHQCDIEACRWAYKIADQEEHIADCLQMLELHVALQMKDVGAACYSLCKLKKESRDRALITLQRVYPEMAEEISAQAQRVLWVFGTGNLKEIVPVVKAVKMSAKQVIELSCNEDVKHFYSVVAQTNCHLQKALAEAEVRALMRASGQLFFDALSPDDVEDKRVHFVIVELYKVEASSERIMQRARELYKEGYSLSELRLACGLCMNQWHFQFELLEALEKRFDAGAHLSKLTGEELIWAEIFCKKRGLTSRWQAIRSEFIEQFLGKWAEWTQQFTQHQTDASQKLLALRRAQLPDLREQEEILFNTTLREEAEILKRKLDATGMGQTLYSLVPQAEWPGILKEMLHGEKVGVASRIDLTLRYRVQESQFKKGVIDADPEKKPEESSLKELLALFDTINFSNPEMLPYYNPELTFKEFREEFEEERQKICEEVVKQRPERDQEAVQQEIAREIKTRFPLLIRRKLESVVAVVEARNVSFAPADPKRFYEPFENAVIHTVRVLQRREDEASGPKEKQLRREETAQVLFRFVRVKGLCFTQYKDTALASYRTYVLRISPEFEENIYQELASYREELFRSTMSPPAYQSIHYFTKLVQSLGEEFGVPGTKAAHDNGKDIFVAGASFDAVRDRVRFKGFYTVENIVARLLDALAHKYGRGYVDWWKSRIPGQFQPKEVQAAQQKLKSLRDANGSEDQVGEELQKMLQVSFKVSLDHEDMIIEAKKRGQIGAEVLQAAIAKYDAAIQTLDRAKIAAYRAALAAAPSKQSELRLQANKTRADGFVKAEREFEKEIGVTQYIKKSPEEMIEEYRVGQFLDLYVQDKNSGAYKEQTLLNCLKMIGVFEEVKRVV